MAHGTYSLTIVDPILFVKQFLPATYLHDGNIFDFTDKQNPSADQIFSEVIGSLAAAFSSYTNDPHHGNRITRIQQDSLGFANSLSKVIENAYQWKSTRGLSISNVTVVGIRYDDSTNELLKTVQRADALSGSRGNSNLQASFAAGIQSAGKEGGAAGIMGLGIAGASVGLSSLFQQAAPKGEPIAQTPPDLVTKLEGLRRALEAGLITKEEFDAAKAKALGL